MLASLTLLLSTASAQSEPVAAAPEPTPAQQLASLENELAALGSCTVSPKAKRDACLVQKSSLEQRRAELETQLADLKSAASAPEPTGLELDVGDE